MRECESCALAMPMRHEIELYGTSEYVRSSSVSLATAKTATATAHSAAACNFCGVSSQEVSFRFIYEIEGLN
eukprot:scaffold228294_cov35-Tisochrysis_lutea.AAC.1